ncbi:MAG TPA: tetratricopeptide repeat protein [Stellaceae bacterium]|nr:tetratricopeptide repeat protein [Stellaceae bacterium]
MATIARWLLVALFAAISGCSPGKQVSLDPAAKKAVEDLKQQAEKGDPVAQWQLGSRYDSGQGVPSDGAEAEKWYRRSADSGYAEAQNSLGSAYQAEHRYADAVGWYQKGADQGHALALNNLAYMYDLGLGVTQDRHHAFELYMKAADQGNPQAMFNIAVVYGAGQVRDPNLEQAYVWLLRAKRYRTNCFSRDSKTDNRVDGAIRYSEGKLSSDEQDRARRIAADWSPAGACDRP